MGLWECTLGSQIPSLVVTGNFVMNYSSQKCVFKVFSAGVGNQVLQFLLADYSCLISRYHTKSRAGSPLFSSSSLTLHSHPGKEAVTLDLGSLLRKALKMDFN